MPAEFICTSKLNKSATLVSKGNDGALLQEKLKPRCKLIQLNRFEEKTMVTSESKSPLAIDWSSAIWSGIIAGAVFMMLEMIMVPMFLGGSPWGPPRMIAAIGMGKGVLPPPDTFALVPMMVAMAIHFMLSIVLVVILAFVVNGLGIGAAGMVGAIFGVVIYLINFYALTAVFPWFEMARNWISIFAHIVFGAVAALSYKWLQKPNAHASRV